MPYLLFGFLGRHDRFVSLCPLAPVFASLALAELLWGDPVVTGSTADLGGLPGGDSLGTLEAYGQSEIPGRGLKTAA